MRGYLGQGRPTSARRFWGVGLVVCAMLAALPAHAPARADGIEDSNDCYDQFRGGDNKLAIYYCTRAIQSGELGKEDLVAALINRGVAHKNQGNLTLAIADYSAALERAPNDHLIYSNRANAYRAMGELPPALADANEALTLKPDSARAFYVRGTVYEAIGDRVSARLDYQRAHELAPDNADYKAKAEVSEGASD